MDKTNIWKGLDFSNKPQRSAFDILSEQIQLFVVQTGGELKMELEAIDAYIDEEPPRLAALYILYVVAPKLGNFRRKILTVAEYSEIGRFPVDIVCNIDSSKLEKIEEINFIDTIEEILNKPLVKSSIENLYRQSVEYKNINITTGTTTATTTSFPSKKIKSHK
jgi:hypothetical protein